MAYVDHTQSFQTFHPSKRDNPFTSQENREMFLKLKNATGDEKASLIERLVLGNMAMVHRTVRKRIMSLEHFCNTARMTPDEVVAVGVEALFKSILKYDVGTGISFMGYASVAIDRELIQLAVRKVPKWSENKSLDEEILSDSSEPDTLLNLLESSDKPLEEMAIDKIFLRQLYKHITETFSQRDIKVYLEYIDGASQDDLASKYGISQPYISRILKKIAIFARNERDAV